MMPDGHPSRWLASFHDKRKVRGGCRRRFFPNVNRKALCVAVSPLECSFYDLKSFTSVRFSNSVSKNKQAGCNQPFPIRSAAYFLVFVERGFLRQGHEALTRRWKELSNRRLACHGKPGVEIPRRRADCMVDEDEGFGGTGDERFGCQSRHSDASLN